MEMTSDSANAVRRFKFVVPSFLRIWSHLLEKSLMENFILCAVFLLSKGFNLEK